MARSSHDIDRATHQIQVAANARGPTRFARNQRRQQRRRFQKRTTRDMEAVISSSIARCRRSHRDGVSWTASSRGLRLNRHRTSGPMHDGSVTYKPRRLLLADFEGRRTDAARLMGNVSSSTHPETATRLIHNIYVERNEMKFSAARWIPVNLSPSGLRFDGPPRIESMSRYRVVWRTRRTRDRKRLSDWGDQVKNFSASFSHGK